METKGISRFYDYTLHLPCMETDTMELLNFISKYFFELQEYQFSMLSEQMAESKKGIGG
jgi:hypothetical protein